MKDGMVHHQDVNVSIYRQCTYLCTSLIILLYFPAVQCEPPSEIANGVLEIPSNDTMFGSIVFYTCSTGYKLVGPKNITCLANGQYDALPPTCQGDYMISKTINRFVH